MTDTANLALPLLDAAQAQKHVTHNEALRVLDTLVQLAVADRDLNAPPPSPAEGQRWIVKASPSPTGAWAGHGNHIVAWQDGGWTFSAPQAGWLAFVVDEALLVAWDGSAWVGALDVMSGLTTLQNLSLLGVGTTADSTNPLSAKLNNALWTAKTVAEGGDGNLRYKMSKESAAKTLSLLLQDNFSGRAEIGLTGDDDLHLKVSADGATWLDAITIDKSTAKLTLGAGFADKAATRAQVAAAPFDALAFNGMQVNGNADVSQELGTTGATLASGTSKYIADCVEAQYVHGAGTAVVTSAQIAATSFPVALPGYSFGHQIKATTALSSPANGDYALHRWRIEGYRVARLGWGASGAQPLAYAFQFYSTASGTAFAKFSNSDRSRNYYKELTVAAGWNFFSGTIAGDTSGTWNAGNGTGLIVEVFAAGKAASPASAGAWTSTNTTQTTSSTNLLGASNNLIIMTGLIVLPGIELPPSDRAALIMRPFDIELPLCRRYWETAVDYGASARNSGHFTGSSDLNGSSSSAKRALTVFRLSGRGWGKIAFLVTKRAVPAISYWDGAGNASAVTTFDANGGGSAVNDTSDTFRAVTASINGIQMTCDVAGKTYMACLWEADARL